MRFYSLANRNFKEIYRDPVSILLGLIMPIALLILFVSIQQNIPIEAFKAQNLTPGIIVFGFSFLIMFSAVLIAKDKQSAFLVRLFTTPLKASDFIKSYIIAFVPLALLQIAVCLIVGVLLGATFSNIFLSILLLIVVAFLCISLGVMLGALFSVNQVSGIGSLLITIISLFSGAWMDLRMIGGVFESIGYALPFAHAIDAAKLILSGHTLSNISNNLVVIGIFTVVTFSLSIISFKRMMTKV